MTKSTIVRTWLGGLIGVGAGLLMAALSIALMLGYGGTFTPAASGSGYDFAPSLDGFFWLTVAGIITGGILAAAGGVVQLVAWIGAMLNTYRLPEKTWFAVLLIGGLVGLAVGFVGLVTMVVYVIAGPDGTAVQSAAPLSSPSQPTALAPTG